MPRSAIILILLLAIFHCLVCAQQTSINFHKLGLQDGLHDGTIRCIGQDRFGYIWIGGLGALNRFDGKNIKHYTNVPGDTTTLYGGQPRCIHSDKRGRLWIGTESGLMEYDFGTSSFIRTQSAKNVFVNKIAEFGDSLLFLATRSGLIRYNIYTGAAFLYAASPKPEHAELKNNRANDLRVGEENLFIASSRGLVKLHLASDKAERMDIPPMTNMEITSVAIDHDQNIWLGTYSTTKLAKLHADHKTIDIYDNFLSSDVHTQPLNVMDILVDTKNRVWVVTAIDGLLQYQESTNSFFKHLHHTFIPSSPSSNSYRCIYQDDRGIIWLGADFVGVNFFDPDKNLFKTILPFPDRVDERARSVGRAVAEDQQGNIWMGTHDGVTQYNPVTNSYKIWRNIENQPPVIYNNMVRSMFCDAENNVWIGTASGVNRFDSKTGKMEFISEKNLPLRFYNSINGTKSGNIWFGTNDTSGLYWYDLSEKKFSNISKHPYLKKYNRLSPVSYVLEDSKARIWISFSRKGVLMYDKKTNETQLYSTTETSPHTIIGNQVIDIKEDKKGMIWITSFNGISGIDTDNKLVSSFNIKNGLIGNTVAPVVIDSLDRLWVGVNGGLMMLDAQRKNFTSFFLNDGLPSLGFPEHAGIQARNGDIILPSNKGFIRFNPLEYADEKTKLRFYIAGYSVFDKEYYTISENNQDPLLKLRSFENSFTFNLVALNFQNPAQTWYAYKLDGFEKDWHYTRDLKAVYTNIPGGTYTFLYKASTNNNSWDTIDAKHVTIKLKTIFYRSEWFWVGIFLLLIGTLYGIYQYRIRKQKELFQLKSKAQLLEKEKAMVMYEGLKQQLNPHFLFNSLTSLSGLIETDQRMAGDFLEQMSKIYRYILKNRDAEVVSLREEIDFVGTYIRLQKTRFKEGLRVKFNIADDKMEKRIAPVTLQNMVENAIKHNIIDKDSPLFIDIFNEDGYLVIKNNLQKKHVVESSNKQGLSSLQSLYRYLSDRPVVFEESQKDFIIKIPLI